MVGGNLIILIVGMVTVLLSIFSERVAPGDWVTGMDLNCRIFLAHTNAFGLMVLLVSWLARLRVPSLGSAKTALLATRLLPGLYLCSVMAIVLSGPLYLRWIPNPNERR